MTLHSQHRGGISLTEMVVALSLTVAVMSLVASAMMMIFRSQDRRSDFEQAWRGVHRLESFLRSDLRACDEISLAPGAKEGETLKLVSALETIVYELHADHVVRIRHDKLGATRREKFLFPRPLFARWTWEKETGRFEWVLAGASGSESWFPGEARLVAFATQETAEQTP